MTEITPDSLGLVARVAQLTKSYGAGSTAVTALDDVSIGIRKGEFTAIMGPSGSGKSTLMHIMAGLDTATSGRVWIGNTEITGLQDTELTMIRRRRVGFVFQSFNLVPTLDIEGNILLPFELEGRRPSSEEREWIDSLIQSLGLTDRLRHRPWELSGGQQQRVAIARSLAMKPEVILFDEPTSALDPRSTAEVVSVVEDLARSGQTMIIVTHAMGFARAVAHRVHVLEAGKVAESGPPQQIFDAPQTETTRRLLAQSALN